MLNAKLARKLVEGSPLHIATLITNHIHDLAILGETTLKLYESADDNLTFVSTGELERKDTKYYRVTEGTIEILKELGYTVIPSIIDKGLFISWK